MEREEDLRYRCLIPPQIKSRLLLGKMAFGSPAHVWPG
jgi:hypothetical protein